MPDTTIDDSVRRLLLAEHFDAQARQRLRDLGDVALEGLRAAATGSDRGEAAVMKARAIVALGDWPEDEAIETLAAVSGDRRLETRMRAAVALGDIGSDRAVSVLVDRADRADDGVELAEIAGSLGRIGSPGAVAALQSRPRVAHRRPRAPAGGAQGGRHADGVAQRPRDSRSTAPRVARHHAHCPTLHHTHREPRTATPSPGRPRPGQIAGNRSNASVRRRRLPPSGTDRATSGPGRAAADVPAHSPCWSRSGRRCVLQMRIIIK